jgi:hypothetical protein
MGRPFTDRELKIRIAIIDIVAYIVLWAGIVVIYGIGALVFIGMWFLTNGLGK